MTKKIIFGLIAFAILSSISIVCIVNTGISNNINALNRTESDFTTEKFEIREIWELQKTKRQRIEESYIFIKPQNEDFNLRFSDSDYFDKTENKEKTLSQIREGDTVSVKVLKSQLEDARRGGILIWAKRLLQGDKREVTIYKLVNNGRTVTERDINLYDTVDGDFMDRLERTVLILAIILLPLALYTRRKIRHSKKV